MMRVAVSTVGRFHHFDLAAELLRHNALGCLYTGYPKWKVDGIPSAYVRSFPYVVPIEMLAHRFGFEGLARSLGPISHRSIDRWVAANLADENLIVANHGNGLQSFKAARRRGMKSVCDAGIAHTQFTRRVLREEFTRWNAEFADYSSRDLADRLEEFEQADLITVPSTFVKDTFVAEGVDASRVAVVPFGVNLETFHRAEPAADTQAKPFQVLCAGSIGLRKGLPYLLEAFAGLHESIELVIAGGLPPDAKPVLERFAGRARFRYLGFVPRTQMHEVYSRASVFVLPSLVEGLSLAVVQAMACGLPVIVTAATGAAELITDGREGFVIPSQDAASLRERVLGLYEDPLRRRAMADAALRRVGELGGWTQYGRQALAAYAALCGAVAPDLVH